MKLIYIAHPYTTHGIINDNFNRVDDVCKHILQHEPEIIPISPVHAFQFYPLTNSDQTKVIQMCLHLLKQCQEIRFYGQWRKSKGCREEMACALENKIPIQILRYPFQINLRKEAGI